MSNSLHCQIQDINALAQIIASGYKNAFHVHMIVIFQNYAYIQNNERSPSKSMSSEMSIFVTHRQELP